MFDLLLFRHGNTFESGQTALRLGCRDDLPLTKTGEEQAARAVAALASQPNFAPRAVYAPRLRRTWRFAQIVAEPFRLEPSLDDRLIELDYGLWSGQSDEAIEQRFGADSLKNWNARGVWPETGEWGETEAAVKARVCAFAQDARAACSEDGVAVGVSSAGTLRYFLHLVPGQFEEAISRNGLKIKTGHAVHVRSHNGHWALLGWNMPPEQIRLVG